MLNLAVIDDDKDLVTKEYVDTHGGGGTIAADYIVEQGTSNSWAYRKYNSGVAECWRSWTESVTISSKSGNAWYSGEIHGTFPSGLFNAVPNFCSISGDPASTAFSIELGGGLSSTRTQSFWLMRSESAGPSSATTVGIQVHAIGTWK